ncbi:cysteine--tRNA ligase [Treponema pedis]|uniref:Cysteine--tRNA ligase n=1 Tax=Treponema pedis str. T A4 TaxID=1291379 RepID=S5ZYS9_9SPIR|nr:cysteine--tRNA ligase [Treponema pedis]AGT43268.1 cysteinyl-tRNA synthetase [Treponema pedis str. T A4]
MSLQLHNTLGNKKEEFIPIKANHAGIYGCGPTVYDYAHIGNLRTYVFEDILVKTLEALGYEVTHVMNITDVGHLTDDADEGEDKMLKSAEERGKSVLEIAEFYTKAFFNDTERLNIKRPGIVCKATEHIADMINLIKKIEANGHTYMSGGNLYYDISTFPKYGELANINLEDLKAGARIEIDKNKRNPYDFVLWFTKSKFENHALTWDSPWGRGYPGWHIECSAMSIKYLGEQFDIHKGGIDHIRVHHTNEIAQSEGATGKKWVNYWLHNEFLIMNKGKMSKSAGTFIVLEDVIKKGFSPLDYRFLLLGGHYRSQLTFSWEAMETAKNGRKSLNTKISKLLEGLSQEKIEELKNLTNTLTAEKTKTILKDSPAKKYFIDFMEAMEDDLSTPRALSELQGLVKDKTVKPEQALTAIASMDYILGLKLIEEAAEILSGLQNLSDNLIDEAEICKLIEKRAAAKFEKNYKQADEIRDNLKALGIILEDQNGKTTWKRI